MNRSATIAITCILVALVHHVQSVSFATTLRLNAADVIKANREVRHCMRIVQGVYQSLENNVKISNLKTLNKEVYTKDSKKVFKDLLTRLHNEVVAKKVKSTWTVCPPKIIKQINKLTLETLNRKPVSQKEAIDKSKVIRNPYTKNGLVDEKAAEHNDFVLGRLLDNLMMLFISDVHVRVEGAELSMALGSNNNEQTHAYKVAAPEGSKCKLEFKNYYLLNHNNNKSEDEKELVVDDKEEPIEEVAEKKLVLDDEKEHVEEIAVKKMGEEDGNDEEEEEEQYVEDEDRADEDEQIVKKEEVVETVTKEDIIDQTEQIKETAIEQNLINKELTKTTETGIEINKVASGLDSSKFGTKVSYPKMRPKFDNNKNKTRDMKSKISNLRDRNLPKEVRAKNDEIWTNLKQEQIGGLRLRVANASNARDNWNHFYVPDLDFTDAQLWNRKWYIPKELTFVYNSNEHDVMPIERTVADIKTWNNNVEFDNCVISLYRNQSEVFFGVKVTKNGAKSMI